MSRYRPLSSTPASIHAPLDPAQQRARLVEGEIVRGFRAHKINYLGQPIRGMIVRRRALPLAVEDHLPTVLGEHFGNLPDREHRRMAGQQIATIMR
jgi:hypothetical protein